MYESSSSSLMVAGREAGVHPDVIDGHEDHDRATDQVDGEESTLVATVKQPYLLRRPAASVARSAVRPAANQWRRPETPGIAPPRSSRCRQSGRSSRARAETFLRRIVQQRRTRRAGRFPTPRAGPIVVGRGSVSPYPDSSRARGSGGGSGSTHSRIERRRTRRSVRAHVAPPGHESGPASS